MAVVPIDTVSEKVLAAEASATTTKLPDDTSRRWRQHLASILANLTVVCTGVCMAWTAPALPDMQSRSVTTEQASWVSACMPLGALLGALPSGAMAARLGRRGALLALAPVFAIGWLLITFADVNELWLVYLGRVVMGLAVGPSTVIVPMYCEEISEVAVRGALGAYLDMMMGVGNVEIYILGTFLPYFWYTLSGLLVPAIFLITFWWMPESPVYLVSKGRMEKARESLQWLRAPDADLQPELDAMAEAAASPTAGTGVLAALASLRHTNPFRSTTWRAFILVLGLMFFQQASGINAFLLFTVQIFEDAGSSLSGHECSIVTGCVHVGSCLLASVTVDKVGRRFLLLVSAIGMTLCLVAFTIYTYLHTSGYDTASWSWVPLATLVIYLVVYSVGFGSLPWFMMAELLPEQAKGWAASLGVCFNRIFTFLLAKEFPVALEEFGQAPVYSFFTILSFISILFVAFLVPETKGISKAEIQKAVGGDRP